MPKPMYVWSGSAWVSVAAEVESLATYATQSYADNQPGMKLVVPTSVAVGSGSGSIATSGRVSFSGSSSVALNGIFSSTYKNYLIQLSLTGASADGVVYMKLRNSGTDASTNYSWAYVGFNVASADTNTGITGQTLGFVMCSLEADLNKAYYSSTANLFRPFESTITAMSAIHTGSTTAASIMTRSGGGWHTTESSYDGINLITSAGNITGDITVYGYKA